MKIIILYTAGVLFKLANFFVKLASSKSEDLEGFVCISPDKTKLTCGYKIGGAWLMIFDKSLSQEFRSFLKEKL